LANMYFVGSSTDLIIGWDLIPVKTEIALQLGLLLFGIVILGIGSLSYLKAQLGAGPRDTLMIGPVRKLNKPVAHTGGCIEINALILGYLMTRSVGIARANCTAKSDVGYMFLATLNPSWIASDSRRGFRQSPIT
jgi:uncharacterized membrane protein YczE